MVGDEQEKPVFVSVMVGEQEHRIQLTFPELDFSEEIEALTSMEVWRWLSKI